MRKKRNGISTRRPGAVNLRKWRSDMKGSSRVGVQGAGGGRRRGGFAEHEDGMKREPPKPERVQAPGHPILLEPVKVGRPVTAPNALFKFKPGRTDDADDVKDSVDLVDGLEDEPLGLAQKAHQTAEGQPGQAEIVWKRKQQHRSRGEHGE